MEHFGRITKTQAEHKNSSDLSWICVSLVIYDFSIISYNKIVYCCFIAAHSLFSMSYPCIYTPCCRFEELSGNMCNKASKSAWCANTGIVLCNWTTVNGTTQFLYHCENRNLLWILWGNVFWFHDNLYELGVSQLFGIHNFLICCFFC